MPFLEGIFKHSKTIYLDSGVKSGETESGTTVK